MTLANRITIFRILMIPTFIMMAIYYGRSVVKGDPNPWFHYLTILVFLLASVSDGIDGYIARKYNQRSRLGEVLDPIADKGLLIAAILTLSFSNWQYEFPIWFPVLVITRDAVILIGTLILHFLIGHVEVRPSWIGKTATAMQMLAISLVLLQANLFSHHFALWDFTVEFLDIPVAIAGLFTLLSGIGYVMVGIRQLQVSGHTNAR